MKRGYWVAPRARRTDSAASGHRAGVATRRIEVGTFGAGFAGETSRENAVCASCHARFDSFGLAFEGYGPVGERRTKDLAGRSVGTQASFPGGGQGSGLEGLRTYLHARREKDFLNNLSEKLLVYALGRSPLLSDETAIERMRTKFATSDYRISTLIDTIVLSPQFLNTRTPQPQISAKIRRLT